MKLKQASLSALLILGVSTVVTLAREEDMEKVKTEYGFSTWEASRTNDSAMVTNWIPDLEAIGATNVVLYNRQAETSGVTSVDYNCALRQEGQSVRVLICVTQRQSGSQAHEEMMKGIARGSIRVGPERLRTDSVELKIGDRCMAGRANQEIRALTFFRKNVYVKVMAVSGHPDIKKLASALDEQILQGIRGRQVGKSIH